MAEWYYVRNGQQAGPVDASQLVQWLGAGAMQPQDLVWRDGMAQWIPAGSVPELRGPVLPTPVNAPPTAANPHVAAAFPAAAFPGAAPVQQFYAQQPQLGYTPLPHSRLGIASFIIGLFVIVIEMISIGTATALVLQRGGNVPRGSAPAPGMIGAGLGMFAGIFLGLVGAGLGIGGLYQNAKRVFGILGLVINGGILLLVVFLVVIGLVAK